MSTLEPVRPSEPRVPVSPQLALRVAILGGVAMALFAIIFFRLWYLQVLSGEQYVQQANANRARDLPIAAPRGEILDREGQPIVASRVTNAVQVVPSALPPRGAPRAAVYRRLGGLLGMSPRRIEALVIKGRTKLPYASVTIKTAANKKYRNEIDKKAKRNYKGVSLVNLFSDNQCWQFTSTNRCDEDGEEETKLMRKMYMKKIPD